MNSFNELSEERQERVRARMTPLEFGERENPEAPLPRVRHPHRHLLRLWVAGLALAALGFEPLQRETELFPTCFKIMVNRKPELDHEAVLHYLFCLWRDLQGCRVRKRPSARPE